VLGITFKPDTDDIREAPSLTILPILAGEGAKIRAYDPQGRRHAETALPTVEWTDAPMDVADDADAVVLLTEWQEFRDLDLVVMRERMRGHVLLDLRNAYQRADAEAAGLLHTGIGLPAAAEGRSATAMSARRVNGASHANAAPVHVT
jgi:UDPglucose 6-dehydrogenase